MGELRRPRGVLLDRALHRFLVDPAGLSRWSELGKNAYARLTMHHVDARVAWGSETRRWASGTVAASCKLEPSVSFSLPQATRAST